MQIKLNTFPGGFSNCIETEFDSKTSALTNRMLLTILIDLLTDGKMSIDEFRQELNDFVEQRKREDKLSPSWIGKENEYEHLLYYRFAMLCRGAGSDAEVYDLLAINIALVLARYQLDNRNWWFEIVSELKTLEAPIQTTCSLCNRQLEEHDTDICDSCNKIICLNCSITENDCQNAYCPECYEKRTRETEQKDNAS